MRIKSFFARTVEAAISMARQELGPDALLLNSRKAPDDAQHPGEYEVVFATEDSAAAPPPLSAPPLRTTPQPANLAADVASLRKELEDMRRALTQTAFAPPAWIGGAPDLSDAYAVLTANEVSPELARRIVQGAEARADGSKLRGARMAAVSAGPGFQRALVEEIEAQFTVAPGLGGGASRSRIVTLVGPPGVGKTTTLVKLAVNYGLACRRPVQILSLDTYRIGAAEQLRSFAAILGVGFQILETITALSQSLEEHSSKDLILIDTAGLAAAELESVSEFARFLESRPEIDTHLVLSASVKPADLARMVDAYAAFQPKRLLFTRIDETVAHGAILNEAARTGKPLSFFTNGQRIPEDIEEAAASRLVGMVLAGHGGRSRSAA